MLVVRVGEWEAQAWIRVEVLSFVVNEDIG